MATFPHKVPELRKTNQIGRSYYRIYMEINPTNKRFRKHRSTVQTVKECLLMLWIYVFISEETVKFNVNNEEAM